MGYGKEYGDLLEEIAKEADAIAMRYSARGFCELKGKATGRR